jgi:hypothetical protein
MQSPSQCRMASALLRIILFATLGCQSGDGSAADASMGGSCVMPSQPAGAACRPEAGSRCSHEEEAWKMMTRRSTQSAMNVKRTGSHTLQVRFLSFHCLHDNIRLGDEDTHNIPSSALEVKLPLDETSRSASSSSSSPPPPLVFISFWPDFFNPLHGTPYHRTFRRGGTRASVWALLCPEKRKCPHYL